MHTFFNELLQDWLYIIQHHIHDFNDRRKKNEFGYALVGSPSLACKMWALENDWGALLICNPDHRNAKQVFNAMI